jgi:sRNA-binding protein
MGKPQKPTELVTQTRALLAEKFPNCFCPKGTAKKPLKIGIRVDLAVRCPEVPYDLLRKALADYCLGPSYQVALLTVGAERYDLDGNVCGVVTEGHSAMAAARLQGRPSIAVKRWLDEAGVVLPAKKNPAAVVQAATG